MNLRVYVVAAALAAMTGQLTGVIGCAKSSQPPAAADAGAIKYHCPMHPSIVSDKPGNCPICGMKLVPIGQDAMAAPAGPATPAGLAAVSISPAARERMGLTFGTVQRRGLERDVRTSARIAVDETRLYHVTLKVDGWVNHLHEIVTGKYIKKGQPLVTIYSPDLVSAQQEYLIALQSRERLAASADPDARQGADSLLAASRRRLELLDVSEEQIAQIEKTREVQNELPLFAPFSGWVTERNIAAGHKLMAGEPLLVMADLTRVWGEADIYESDLPYVKVGMPAELTLPYWPGRTFKGKVIFISPTVDPDSRTLQARMEIDNTELLLKPGMYANARLHYDLGRALLVPEGAVMFTGEHTYAFKDAGNGALVPVEIKVGQRSAGFYELVSGLNEGDRVVTSANFLVDSESSMKAAMEALAGH
jgi:RND family efflux transporter MFP subunit